MGSLFIMQVITGKEQYYISHAKKMLFDRAGDVRLILPRRRMRIRKKGRFLTDERPVFPGYLFFECDEPDADMQNTMRRIPGYIRFLNREKGVLKPLSEPDRNLVAHLVSGGEIAGSSQVTFDKNNRIVALSGPLKGIEGKIIKVDRRKQRARVRFLLNDKTFIIDFQYEEIQLAEDQKNKNAQ